MPGNLADSRHLMGWKANDARLLRQRLQYCPTNPPHGVRDELHVLRLVKRPSGAKKTEIARADEIHQRDRTALECLRNRYHETEICAHQRVQRIAIAFSDPPTEIPFLSSSQEPISADVVEILGERIGHEIVRYSRSTHLRLQ